MQNAIRQRQLPTEIDTSEWHDLLTKQETQIRRSLWSHPTIFATFAVVNLLAALTSPIKGLGFPLWIGLALFACAAVYAPFDSGRRLRRIRALQADLANRPPQDPPRPE